MNIKDTTFRVATGLHRLVFNASKGRLFARGLGMPFTQLVTTGRKSGKPRSTMLAVPISDERRMVLVASFGGDDRDPAWYRNLLANPEVRVTFKGSVRGMAARTATAEERARLWPEVTATYAGYARYQEATSREIPLVILEPRQAAR
jgi:deazaflavin-dependent oxidoreductase (nitroreductase family)